MLNALLKPVDNFLNAITMYRLVFYYLIFLIGISILFSAVGILHYNPLAILFSTVFLTVGCFVTNMIFSFVFEAPTNVESVYISAFILALIITPLRSSHDLLFVGWAAVLSMSVKYILAIHKKHIFNPVAIAVVLTAFGIGASATWWVGNAVLLPFVIIGGILIVRKIRRSDLVAAYLAASFSSVLFFSFLKQNDLFVTIQKTIFETPIFFFASIMITEPLTTPPTKKLHIFYGALVGFLYAPQIHLGTIYSTPELALVIGNIFSYLVSPKQKLMLKLKEKIDTGKDLVDFIFEPKQKLAFVPGQYMEWTLPHAHVDSRGNRRYFTLASSPTENTLRLGVKFYPNSSSYKKAMLAMDAQNTIVGAQLAGDFVLPKNPQQKLAFIAGGIGITPFRSIIKYLIDTQQTRDMILFYANKTADEIVYTDVFEDAQEQIGLRTVYTLTDPAQVPQNWQGEVGRIDEKMIIKYVPDYMERIFYLSGPHAMVTWYEDVLHRMNVPASHIKIDFFPGFV